METIAFTELVKLIHPDVNPYIKDAGAKMTEAVKNKKNPAILYELGVRWGVIKKTVKEVIMLVVGDMVSFKRPTSAGVEFGTIVGIDAINDYESWSKRYSVKIYTTDERCLNVTLNSLESEKQGVKFVRKVDSFTVARHRSDFNAKSKPQGATQPKAKLHPEADHGWYANEPRVEPVKENPYTSHKVSGRVVLQPNTDYRYDGVRIYTKYGNKTATRTTEKRVYFFHEGKETWKNFNRSTYAWRD